VLVGGVSYISGNSVHFRARRANVLVLHLARRPSSVGNFIDVLLAGQVAGLGVPGPAREIRKNAGVRLGSGASGAAAATGIQNRQASKQGLLK
jgi:hypothetical protein